MLRNFELLINLLYVGAVTKESSDFMGDPAAGVFGLAFSSLALVRTL